MMIPQEVFIAVGIICVAAAFLQLAFDTRQAVGKDGTSAASPLLLRYIGTFAALYMVLRACGIL